MGKHWARQQVRTDEVKDSVEKAIDWVQDNRQTAMLAAGAVVVAALLAFVIVRQRAASRAAAWDRLSVAQGLAYTGRPDASLEQLKKLADEHPGSSAAGFGELFAGDILFEGGKFKEAAERYEKLAQSSDPKLQAAALGGQALAQESQGLAREALQTAQRFLDSHGDHYLAPQTHACLARSLEALGQAEAARAAWQKIALQYPDTTWAAMAQAKIKGPQPKK